MTARDLNTSAAEREPLEVAAAEQIDAGPWATFVLHANDGTLHHELPFLAYHPPDRFRFEHLIVRRGADIVAVVPGGLVEHPDGTVFVSPLGASVGGPLITRPILSETLLIVEALQMQARKREWIGFDFVVGPSAYQRRIADTTAFALFARGFQLIERDLSFVVPLEPGAIDGYASLFRKKQAGSVRAALRRGVEVTHGGVELLPAFNVLFQETYERHGVAATHTSGEIADLLRRLPERVEITLASLAGAPLAAILVFLLNDRAAQTVYICSSASRARENGTVTALAALIDRLAGRGFRALDLGPSASSRRVNAGVVFFKEGLGATGQARDRWGWREHRDRPTSP